MNWLTSAAPIPTTLVWASDAVGIVLMVAAVTGTMILAVLLVQQARRERVAPPLAAINPVKPAAPVRAVA